MNVTYKFLKLTFYSWSQEVCYACTQEMWLLWLCVTLTAPNTPQWGSPPRSTSTSWGVSPTCTPPTLVTPPWVLTAPCAQGICLAGAVEPWGHNDFLFHALSPISYLLILFFYYFIIFKEISKVSVQLPAVIESKNHFSLQHCSRCTVKMLDPHTACIHASFIAPLLSYLLMLARPFDMGNSAHVSRTMSDGITYLFLLNNTYVWRFNDYAITNASNVLFSLISIVLQFA